MSLPFTFEQYFTVLARYNLSMWPLHAGAYLLGAGVLVLLWVRSPYADMTVSAVLAFVWIWIGVGYHLVFLREVTPFAYPAGALFVVQGLLFQNEGVLKRRLRFGPPRLPSLLLGAALVLYAMVAYPLIGRLLGQHFPLAPEFGLAPSPTVVFTFGVLLCVRGRLPLYLLVAPVLWAAAAAALAAEFGLWQNLGVPAAALLTIPMLVVRRSAKNRPEPTP